MSPRSTRVLLPNIFTLVGVCIGLTSIKFALDSRFEMAVIAIIVAGIIDGLDGRIARLIESEFENDPVKVSEISARFSGPVTPGNTLEINSWNQDSYTIANVVEKETGTVVLKDFVLKRKQI